MSSIEQQAKEVIEQPKQAQQASAKRQAWEALQRHTPEIIPAVKLIAERFGVSGVRVETEGEIVEWTNG